MPLQKVVRHQVGDVRPQDGQAIELHALDSGDTAATERLQDELDRQCPEGGFSGYMTLVGSFLGLIVNLGIINSIGAIQVYVANNQLHDILASSISWIFSIYLALTYFLAIVAGPIFDSHGPIVMLAGSGLLIFAGLMASANSVTVWQFVLSFMALGVGNGIGMTPLIGVIGHWFTRNRANCTGIATAGGSVGGLIFPLMLRSLYKSLGYIWAMRIMAFMCLGLMALATLLVRARVSRKPHGNGDDAKPKSMLSVFSALSPRNLRDTKYLFVVLGGFFAELSLVLVLTYFALYAMARGVSESTSYLLLTVWNGVGIAGRLLPGWAADRYGCFNVNVLMLSVYSISTFVMWLPFGGSQGVLFAYAAVAGFSLGAILSLLPACLALITPVDEIGSKYGFLNSCLSIANLFGVPIASTVIGRGTVHRYSMFVVFVGCLALCGTVSWYCARYKLVGFKLNVRI